MKLNLSPKSFLMLAGGVFVLGMGLCYMTYSSISEKETTVANLRKELKDEKEVQAELEATELKIVDLKQKLEHLEGGVPKFAYIPTLLNELEAYGKKNSIQILQVKPIIGDSSLKKDGEKRKTAYEEQNIIVKGRGSYGDAMRFIQALKVFPKIVAVRTLSLTPKFGSGETTSTKPTLDIDIELRAFAFKDHEKDEEKDSEKSANAKKEVKTNES